MNYSRIISNFLCLKERSQLVTSGRLGDNGPAALRHVVGKELFREHGNAFLQNGEEMNVRLIPRLKQKIVIQILVQV